MTAPDRPICTLRLRALPNVDGIYALRQSLKTLLRQFGMQCLSIDSTNRKNTICCNCGRKLDDEAIACNRDICFDCYSRHQD